MKPEFIRCPHCGILHRSTMRSCPATGAAMPHAASEPPEGGRGVNDTAGMARLVVQTAEGERTFYLRPMNSLGRHPNNSIQVLDKIVSKEHCRIERDGERFILRDLGSLNGTYLNGERVRGSSGLSHGDLITLGATRAVFYETGSLPPSASEPEGDNAAERFLAHLALAKPTYQPGETLYARAAVLDVASRAPLGRSVTVAFEVRSARGDIIAHRAGQVAAGVAPFSWSIPADLGAGEFTLFALFPVDGFPPAEIPFSVRAYEAPRLHAELERDAVGLGDEVEATVSMPALEEDLASDALSFYPEGGDLLVGVPARLYIEARTSQGKPADVAGRILDGAGTVLARFRTEHEGRGRVTLTPTKVGRAYMAVLDEPAAVSELFPLPEVRREGLTLVSLDDATHAEEAVRLRIFSTAATKARVVLYAREREVAAVRVELLPGEGRDVALTPPGAIDGVLRATVYDAAGLPRAERLIFRRPRRSLRIAIEPPSTPLAPGSPVSVRIRTTSAEGQPVSATVTIAVVDDLALDAVAPRDRPPRLPAQALLGSEVRELSDPEAYLGEDEAARRRLDLLLGTQGWRRLAFYDVTRFMAEHGDRAARVFAQRRPVAPALGMLLPGRQPMGMGPGGAAIPLPDPNSPTAPRAPRPELPEPAPPPPIAPPAPARGDRRSQSYPPSPALRPPGPQATLREYAHRAQASSGASGPVETLYWNAGLVTRESGEATIAFDLSDVVSTFRIRADAFGADGALGEGEATITSRR
jgi:hypothetical protein